MSLALHYAVGSDVGLLREGNEDSVYAGPRLLAVADGMGGHAAGEVASAVAITCLAPLDEDVPGTDLLDKLREAVLVANEHLREMVSDDSALDGMGTTLTAMLSAGSRVGIAHVGDSRAYLLREGDLHQITRDHTLVQSLVDEGRISAEEAGSHPQRSLLTRALDGRGGVELDLSVREAQVGDRYLLCTDGLSGVVSPETMAEALRLAEPQQAVDRLIELALRGGGPDNVTCIVADVVSTSGDDNPMVAGAVAESSTASRGPVADSPALRAAQARRKADADGQPIGGRQPKAPPSDDDPVARHAMRNRLLIGVGVLVLLGAVATVGWGYVRAQYFVGTDGGQVAVYRGVKGTVAGWHLSSVRARPGIAVGDLPPVVQQRLREGIPARNAADARQITDRLARQAANERCLRAMPTVPPSTPPGTQPGGAPAGPLAPPAGPVPAAPVPTSAAAGPPAAVPGAPVAPSPSASRPPTPCPSP